MRGFVLLSVLLISCTPAVEKIEHHDRGMTDSALSVLNGITSTYRVDTVSIEKIVTVRRVESVVVPSPVISPMVSHLESRCDTVWLRDTVWLSR
jgi:hypothetical protein